MTRIELSTPLVLASPSSRTISGRIVTWGEVGNTSAGPVRFARGSIHAPADLVLVNEHDTVAPLGRATELSSTPDGMDASFKIAATSRGNDALVEAADGLRSGFSVGVDVDTYNVEADGSWTVTASRLDHVGLVTRPAIQSAVVTDVAATFTPAPRDTDPAPVEPEPTPDTDPAPVEPEAPEEETPVADTTSDPVAEVTAAYVPAAKVQDAFPYRPGGDHSFFRDMYNSRVDVAASERVRRAQIMIEAAGTTDDIPEIIPPGYRPDLYVNQLTVPTPMSTGFMRYPLTDATPFKIPQFGSASGLSGDHVEGVNPTDGTLAFDEITVSPKAVSGQYTASREMLDAANPSLDQIIMSAMMEEYANDLEAYVTAQIVAGASGGTAVDEANPTLDLITAIAQFANLRHAQPDRVFALPLGYQGLATEVDEVGRPMNPYLAPSNASGGITSGVASLSVAGLSVVNTWALALSGQFIVAKAADAAVWTSGVKSWRWEEVAGPANIRFAHFGYVAAAITRPAGVYKLAWVPTP